MERVTISMSDEFAAELAVFMPTITMTTDPKPSAISLGVALSQANLHAGVNGECVAALSYVFNHHTRELARRLTDAHHHRHELQVATMHVHLDHESCLELGCATRRWCRSRRLLQVCDRRTRGVVHGQVNFIPVMMETMAHAHQGEARDHLHLHPKN